jgi:hypothetical protein
MTSVASDGTNEPPSPTQDLLGEPFRLDSITEVTPPDGHEGSWHRYVIMQGGNRITGVRSGTRFEVSSSIENLVERLNERFKKRQPRLEDTAVRARGAVSFKAR